MGCSVSKVVVTRDHYYAAAKPNGFTIHNILIEGGIKKDNKGIIKELHNYKMGSCIGQGAFGEVYRCWNLLEKSNLHKNGTPGAVKIIKMQKNYIKEISILSKINHPNIVRLPEYIEDPDEKVLYLIMECLGSVLCSCSPTGVLNESPWHESRARMYFSQLFESLEYLHTMDIAHRDIKPENIVFTQDRTSVKLIDFGESRHFKTGDDSCKQTTGTPQYHSPELAVGTGAMNSDKAKDVWSLGVTLYLVLVGKIPFGEGEQNQLTLWEKISQDSLTFPKNGPQLSQEATILLGKLLEKNQTLRITPSEAKDSSWITGFEHAPRLTNVVTNTTVVEYPSVDSLEMSGTTELVSSCTPLVIDRNPGWKSISKTTDANLSTPHTSSIASPVQKGIRGIKKHIFSSLEGSDSLGHSPSSPLSSFNSESPSAVSLTTTSSRRTSCNHLPKTPKIMTVVSIPALHHESTTSTPTNADSVNSSPNSSPRGMAERTPVSDILTIVSQDCRSKIKILVVDDDFHQRNIISRMMKDLIKPQVGVTCTIDTAEDGDEAVRAVLDSKEEPYSLIILDIHMPRVSGIAASMDIRVAEQQYGRLEVPIFGITSDPSKSLKDLCRKAGMQALLMKPILPDVLRDILQWTNIPCNRDINDVFTATNGWHSSCKKHIERCRARGSATPNIDWWYTVDFDDDSSLSSDSPKSKVLPPILPPPSLTKRSLQLRQANWT